MADKYWNGGSNNFQTAANWGGVAPASGDRLFIDKNAVGISAGLSNPAVTDITLEVGPKFSGAIGSVGAPLELGSGVHVVFDGLACPSAYLDAVNASGGDSNTLKVQSTSENNDALVIDGDWEEVMVWSGRVTIASTAVITTLHSLASGARITVQAGASIGTWNHDDGQATTAAAVTTLNVWAGEVECNSDTTLTYATMNLHGGLVRFHVKDGVVSALNSNAGTFTDYGDHRGKSITLATVRPKAKLWVTAAVTGTVSNYGGSVKGAELTIDSIITESSGEGSGGGLFP